MADTDLPSSQTLRSSSPPPPFSLRHLPPIFVSATHFDTDDLHELEEELVDAGARLTYDVTEARIVVTKVAKKARVLFDLRGKGLWAEEVVVPKVEVDGEDTETEGEVKEGPAVKRRKVERVERVGKSKADAIVVEDESTESEAESSARVKPAVTETRERDMRAVLPKEEDLINVVKTSWFENSRKAGRILPFDNYLTLQCRRIKRPISEQTTYLKPSVKQVKKPITATTQTAKATNPSTAIHILERAKEDAEHAPKPHDRFGKRTFTAKEASWAAGHTTNTKYAHLLQETTTEHDQGISSDLPEMPDWVKQNLKYSCERSTPPSSPNDAFIALLKKIKLARLLTNDEIGVRAYSTSIASLAAYSHALSSPREILALPGCDAKIANLFVEFANSGGSIQAVTDIDNDEELKVLRLFYEIWGVGATTAREFYYERGWRDLDDVVEYGWATLTRVQQIGVKFYEELLTPIPRDEVEEIGRIVHRHAVSVRDEGVQSLIVGGYRRGKRESGDVDVLVSHPDERQTLNLVNDVVASLEEEGWVTHTLLLSLHNTKREQETLPFRASRTSSGLGGGGFDTLDKALVVWQDPSFHTSTSDDKAARNPNIHRRVDIIIAPWRAVGCAVAGWSGGTTFQRDLRRYCKNVRGWKFDSSGVRERGSGGVVDVEGYFGGGERAGGMVEAERRVFEGVGLVWREPGERCTG
ncbi:hypothetical protein LTR08_005179 [Meristemomyces frigidus]|nr:hypothetical protein LTR08_005179 [Meristemomyces frigidus]